MLDGKKNAAGAWQAFSSTTASLEIALRFSGDAGTLFIISKRGPIGGAETKTEPFLHFPCTNSLASGENVIPHHLLKSTSHTTLTQQPSKTGQMRCYASRVIMYGHLLLYNV